MYKISAEFKFLTSSIKTRCFITKTLNPFYPSSNSILMPVLLASKSFLLNPQTSQALWRSFSIVAPMGGCLDGSWFQISVCSYFSYESSLQLLQAAWWDLSYDLREPCTIPPPNVLLRIQNPELRSNQTSCTAVQRINGRAPKEMFPSSVLATTRSQVMLLVANTYLSLFLLLFYLSLCSNASVVNEFCALLW